ncbi:hypothetical protein ACI2OX_16565 [Bacillus sp. N9]
MGKTANSSTAFSAAASLLAWNDLFSEQIESEVISRAESLLADSQNSGDTFNESVKLFHAIQSWARTHKLDVNESTVWLMEQLARGNDQYVLLNDKQMIESLIKSDSLSGDAIMYRYDQKSSKDLITDKGRFTLTDAAVPDTVVDKALPSKFYMNIS